MSSQNEVAKKHSLVMEMLKKDRLTPPAKIIDAVVKKFGSGISKADISRIRADEFQVMLGPGGHPVELGKKRNTARAAKAVRPGPQNLHATESQDRLHELLQELKGLHVSTVAFDTNGNARVVRTVQQELLV
jgi:hypothetical protein